MNRGSDSSCTMWIVLVVSMHFPGFVTESFAGTETITKEAREVVEATKEYTVQQKEAFQQKAHEELIAVQKQITAVQAKALEVSAATRADLQKSINQREKNDVGKSSTRSMMR